MVRTPAACSKLARSPAMPSPSPSTGIRNRNMESLPASSPRSQTTRCRKRRPEQGQADKQHNERSCPAHGGQRVGTRVLHRQ